VIVARRGKDGWNEGGISGRKWGVKAGGKRKGGWKEMEY